MRGIRADDGDVLISVHVSPRAAKDTVKGYFGDQIRIAVASPPARNRANERLVRFVAEKLSLPRTRVALVQGGASKNKVLRVTGISADEAQKRLFL